MNIDDLIKKSQNGEAFSKAELIQMLELPPDSDKTYRLLAQANRISKDLTANRAEVHAQFALNLAPCRCSCAFCSFSGAARRIAIPGTAMDTMGMISELRMAQIVAVTRLALPRSVLGNCTHEPCTLGGLAGANLFWVEAGANPRDVSERTEEGRGATIADCRRLFNECGWDNWQAPSRFYNGNPTRPAS